MQFLCPAQHVRFHRAEGQAGGLGDLSMGHAFAVGKHDAHPFGRPQTARTWRGASADAQALRWRDPLILAGLCIAFVPALLIGGFMAASAAFLLAAMHLFGISWRLAVPVTIGTLAALWLVFVRLFGVPL